MKGPTPRITLRIDRITIDNPGLDQSALETALRDEIARRISAPGTAGSFGPDSYRPQVRAALPAPAEGALAKRVAAATIGGLNPRLGTDTQGGKR